MAEELEPLWKTLKDEIDGIQERQSTSSSRVRKADVCYDLGIAIGKKSGASVEKWARETSGEMPSIPDLEALALELRWQGGLQGSRFDEFLIAGGHPRPAAVLPPPPIMRPPRDPFFAGRNERIEELLQHLRPGRIVALYGTGGIGKTTLVAELIALLAPDDRSCEAFPDGIFYWEFYYRPSVDEAMEEIARRFGQDETPSPNPQAAASRHLRNKQALLVLDGAEEADDLDALLRIRQECCVLIASRYHLKSRVGQPVYLDVLPLEEAVEVLRAWSTDRQDAGAFSVWGDDELDNRRVAEQICEIIGCLPLALRLAGSNLRHDYASATLFLEALKESPLALLDEDARQHQSVPYLLQAMIGKVEEEARQLLAVVGVLSYEAFNVETMSVASGLPELRTRRLLNRLSNLSLLKTVHRLEGRYQVVHRLVHTYVADPAHGLVVPEGAVRALAKHYVSQADSQYELGVDGRATLEKERSHILALQSSCGQEALWQEVISLAWAIDPFLDAQGHWTERLVSLETGLKAAQATGGRDQEGHFLSNLGYVHHAFGRYEEAIDYYQRSVAVSQELGDRAGEGRDLGNLGVAYEEMGQVEEAIGYFERALDIAYEEKDRRGQGAWLGYLGVAYAALGQIEEAIDSCVGALEIAREVGDRRGESTWLHHLGEIFQELGQLEDAVDYYQQALEISRETGDRQGEGAGLGSLGRVYLELGDLEEAIEYFQQALEISQGIGDRPGEATDLGNLGRTYQELGQVEEALDYYQQALEISQEIGDLYGEAAGLSDLGHGYEELGNLEEAMDRYQQALEISHEIGFRQGEGAALGNLGQVYQDMGQVDKAIKTYQQALDISQEIRDMHTVGVLFGKLGSAYQELGEETKAVEHYQQALR